MPSISVRLSALSLAVAFAAPAFAQNDDCLGALPIVDGANGPFSTVGATNSTPAMSCGLGGADLWYLYVASCTGTVTIDTCGGTFDTVLEGYNLGTCGGSCAALPTPVCNDDFCGGPPARQSSITLNVAAGNVVYVRLGGFNGLTGSAPINVTCTPGGGGGPADDEAIGATPVVLGVNAGFSNVGYTTSSAFPCSNGGNDRWFLFVANCSAPHTFKTCGSALDTVMEVFQGTPPCSLVSMACNDDTCGLQSSVTQSLVSGSAYWVRVGGWNSGTGNFDLTIETGTGAGTIAPSTTVSACSFGIALAVTGNANIGNTLNVAVNNLTIGIPAWGYGFTPNAPLGLPCGCTVITSPIGGPGEFFLFSAGQALPIPCDINLIGVQAEFQGFEFFGTGSCTVVPGIQMAASDITTVTVG